VHLHEVADDRETDAEPAVRPFRARRLLPEAVEHEGHELRVHPAAGVAHGHDDVPVLASETHPDGAAARRELHGVVQEVPEHLLEARGVPEDRAGSGPDLELETDLPRRRGRPDTLDRAVERSVGLDRSDVEPHLARRDPRDVEQVRDELRLDARVALDHREGVLELAPGHLTARDAVLEERRPADDRVQRRAQLVGHRRQELVLQAVRLLRLAAGELLALEQVLALELDRDPFRDVGDDGEARVGIGVVGDAPLELDARAVGPQHRRFPRQAPASATTAATRPRSSSEPLGVRAEACLPTMSSRERPRIRQSAGLTSMKMRSPLKRAMPSRARSKIALNRSSLCRSACSARRVRRNALMVATSTGGSTGCVRYPFGAGVQAEDLVLVLHEGGGKMEDRDARDLRNGPDAPHDLEPVDVGQVHVEHDEVRLALRGRPHALRPARGGDHLEARGAEHAARRVERRGLSSTTRMR
jgi:hypothetical protein